MPVKMLAATAWLLVVADRNLREAVAKLFQAVVAQQLAALVVAVDGATAGDEQAPVLAVGEGDEPVPVVQAAALDHRQVRHLLPPDHVIAHQALAGLGGVGDVLTRRMQRQVGHALEA